MASYTHQDWSPVIIHTKKTLEVQKATSTLPKTASISSTTGKLARTIEKNEEEGKPLARVETHERQRLVQLRTSLKLRQEDVARLADVHVSVIKDIEAGNALKNAALMSKIIKRLESRCPK